MRARTTSRFTRLTKAHISHNNSTSYFTTLSKQVYKKVFYTLISQTKMKYKTLICKLAERSEVTQSLEILIGYHNMVTNIIELL